MAAAKVKTLAEQKQDLIARGDLYRRAIADDLQQMERSIGWVPRTFSLLKAAAPLLVLSGPLAGWLLRGRRKSKPSKNGEPSKEKIGVLARVWGAIRLAQQVVPFVHGFMQAWPKVKAQSARKAEPVHTTHRT